jgi:pyruvate formate lyase activating enzyme
MFNTIRCIAECNACLEACPADAITFVEQDKGIKIDREKCSLCMKCVEVCPPQAIERVGSYMTVEEVLGQVLDDKIFYQNSGGGLTVSGGEPLVQGEFVTELCRRAKEEGIHTALDTSGYASWSVMKKILRYIDLVLFDVKHMDVTKHKDGTGISNELVLENARKTASTARTWIRVPLIPGFNDSKRDIEELAGFASGLNVEKISILPYHEYGIAKYTKLGRVYHMEGISPSPEGHLAQIVERIENYGLRVTVSS